MLAYEAIHLSMGDLSLDTYHRRTDKSAENVVTRLHKFMNIEK